MCSITSVCNCGILLLRFWWMTARIHARHAVSPGTGSKTTPRYLSERTAIKYYHRTVRLSRCFSTTYYHLSPHLTSARILYTTFSIHSSISSLPHSTHPEPMRSNLHATWANPPFIRLHCTRNVLFNSNGMYNEPPDYRLLR